MYISRVSYHQVVAKVDDELAKLEGSLGVEDFFSLLLGILCNLNLFIWK